MLYVCVHRAITKNVRQFLQSRMVVRSLMQAFVNEIRTLSRRSLHVYWICVCVCLEVVKWYGTSAQSCTRITYQKSQWMKCAKWKRARVYFPPNAPSLFLAFPFYIVFFSASHCVLNLPEINVNTCTVSKWFVPFLLIYYSVFVSVLTTGV